MSLLYEATYCDFQFNFVPVRSTCKVAAGFFSFPTITLIVNTYFISQTVSVYNRQLKLNVASQIKLNELSCNSQ